jgi:hypothetical protein
MVASRVGGSATSLCPSDGRYPLPMGSLLIDRQHDGMVRRINVQPNDLLELGGKLRVVGQLELAYQMGLRP